MIARAPYPHRPNEDIERYLRDLSSIPPLAEGELQASFALVRNGDMDAHERLALAHLRLVVKIACQYVGYGLPLGDMISEGNLGLLRAVELYNPDYGTAFETYASVWIRQRIHRAITAQAKVVRIPVWRSQRLRKLDRLHEDLNAELGRDATLQELAERLGMKSESLAAISGERTLITSLDDTENSDASVNFMLVDDSPLPEEHLSQRELHEEIMACLADLDDHELQVLSLKFGLLDDAPKSYREMAPQLGRNRELIRTTGERALKKVRATLSKLAGVPRKLVAERRRKTAERLREIKKNTQSLSLNNTVLIPWVEALMPIL